MGSQIIKSTAYCNQKMLAQVYINSAQNTSFYWIIRLLLSLLCRAKVIPLSDGYCTRFPNFPLNFLSQKCNYSVYNFVDCNLKSWKITSDRSNNFYLKNCKDYISCTRGCVCVCVCVWKEKREREMERIAERCSVFHLFRQAKFAYGRLILSSSQFLLPTQQPLKWHSLWKR